MNDTSKTSIFRRESLERLSSPEQLDQLMQVVTPKSWIPLASLGALIVLAILWSILGRIPITATGKGVLVHPTGSATDLVGLTYFSRREGERIRPGMPLTLVPDTVGSERLGGLQGRVKTVSRPSVTTLEAARQAETSDTLATQADAIEVLVELDRDPTTRSGYRWSSMGGQTVELLPGTPTSARIILEEQAPITFILPFLEVTP